MTEMFQGRKKNKLGQSQVAIAGIENYTMAMTVNTKTHL